MKIVFCVIAMVMVAMNVQAKQYGLVTKVFMPKTSKIVVRAGGRRIGEVMKSGEKIFKAGISAKKIEATGKAVGYGMAGGATVVAAHSMTSESRAKGKGIGDWNKRMEEEFMKLPQEEKKELIKDVINKNFDVGWCEVVEFVVSGCLFIAALLGAFFMWRKTRDKYSSSSVK